MMNRPFTSSLLMTVLAFVVTTGCQAQTNTDGAYEAFKAYNNITIHYTVLLPEGYDANRAYPAIVAFPADEMGQADADEMTERLWKTPASREGWIIVVPLVPGEDWRTHPNHHALNDLMDHVKETYRIQSKFHIMGYGQMGSDIASTWSGMSREYFSSLTTVSGAPYRRWDESDLKSLPVEEGRRLDVLVVVGSEDDTASADAKAAQARLDKINHPLMVEVVEGDGETLSSLAEGGVLRLMAARLLHH